VEIFHEQVQSPTQDKLHITIIKLIGEMDGSNSRDVVAKVEEVCAAGARSLIIDLSEMSFMSSAGLATLHHIAVLMRNNQPPGAADRLSSLYDMQEEKASSTAAPEKYVKLLNPQPRVKRSLEQIGYNRIFEIFTEREAALASYS
jgi:anti-anti-sigma factor